MLLHLVLYPMRKVTNNVTSELLTHFPIDLLHLSQ